MITRFAIALAILGALSACNASTSSSDDEDTTDEDTVEETDSFPLPGTVVNPTASQSFARSEELDLDTGNGMLVDPSYDADTDTFFVDNLAFDGENTYNKSSFSDLAVVRDALGPFGVYENAAVVIDPVNNETIPQLQHKAVYAVSASGQTELAIVRTGAFVDYGFGGFVYSRNGGVTIPESGQASYSGSYVGLRDHPSEATLEYVVGDANVYIDFDDYNDGNGVLGVISNRQIYDAATQTDLTADYVSMLETDYNTTLSELPTLRFRIGPGLAQSNGEVTGTVFSTVFDGNESATVSIEEGTFYAVLSDGADNDVDAEEIVGVVVIEPVSSNDTDYDDLRETGGFLATR